MNDTFDSTISKLSLDSANTSQSPDSPQLSFEEQQIIADMVAVIDVENSKLVLEYGVTAQAEMAKFSERALEKVRTQDLGEVGEQIVKVVGELKNFDAEEQKRFFGLFRKQADRITTLKARFAEAETNVAVICDSLTKHQGTLMNDTKQLDDMYSANLEHFRNLTRHVLAGKQKLTQLRSGKLAELEAKAQASGLAEDAQAARDFSDKCDRFEKRIHDLELTRQISIQTAPQIRMIQNNNMVMVEKIQTTLMNTIPLWKNQMVLALGIAHSTEAAAAQKQVTDITNALLKQNAERLHLASVETAKEAERGIVDIETLKETNAKLIQTFDDVMKIQAEGRAKRLAAESEMLKMENDLKQKLLQIRSGN